MREREREVGLMQVCKDCNTHSPALGWNKERQKGQEQEKKQEKERGGGGGKQVN